MINELTHKDGERVALNSYRYAWTVISNIFVYAMASILFGSHAGEDKNDITPEDAYIFRALTFIVIGVGLVCMIIFHMGIKESELPAEETQHRLQLSLSSSGRLKRMTWKSVLREKQFYQCALIWMFTRIILNVTQVRECSFLTEFYFEITLYFRYFFLYILLIRSQNLIKHSLLLLHYVLMLVASLHLFQCVQSINA
jgi:Na+/melibiose symporter-like transporter